MLGALIRVPNHLPTRKSPAYVCSIPADSRASTSYLKHPSCCSITANFIYGCVPLLRDRGIARSASHVDHERRYSGQTEAGFRRSGIPEVGFWRKDSREAGFQRGWIPEKLDSGEAGFRRSWIPERRDSGEAGFRRGGIPAKLDSGVLYDFERDMWKATTQTL
jgi:hypothetical protein